MAQCGFGDGLPSGPAVLAALAVLVVLAVVADAAAAAGLGLASGTVGVWASRGAENELSGCEEHSSFPQAEA